MADLTNINSSEWQMSLYEPGTIVQGLDALRESLQILLTTERGSCVFRPDYGVENISNIGKPSNEAVVKIIESIEEQVETYEPRIQLLDIQAEVNISNLIIQITWTSALGVGSNILNYAYTA